MLNTDTPIIEAYLRESFLNPQLSSLVPVVIFGLASIEGRAIGFHCLTNRGAQIARLPLHAFCWKEDAPKIRELEDIELWDCFSYYPSCIEYKFLSNMRCSVRLKSCTMKGNYLFTVDWCNSDHSEMAGENGHKCAHIIKLDDGNFAAQPNNRIYWKDPAFISHPFADKERPDYKSIQTTWSVERDSDWETENTEAMFYKVK